MTPTEAFRLQGFPDSFVKNSQNSRISIYAGWQCSDCEYCRGNIKFTQIIIGLNSFMNISDHRIMIKTLTDADMHYKHISSNPYRFI